MEIWKKMWVGVFFWTQCISRDIINRSEFWLDSICGNPRACFYVSHYVSRRLLYNAVYAETPKTVTDKLQRVLNAAARVASDTRKFDRGLTSLLHDELHWLDVPERVTYKMGVMMYRCLHGQAPRYLANHFTTSSDVGRMWVCVLQTVISSFCGEKMDLVPTVLSYKLTTVICL